MSTRRWIMYAVIATWVAAAVAQDEDQIQEPEVELRGDATPQDLAEVLRDWPLFLEGVREYGRRPSDPFRYCELALLTPDSLKSLGRLTPFQMSHLRPEWKGDNGETGFLQLVTDDPCLPGFPDVKRHWQIDRRDGKYIIDVQSRGR